MAFAIALAGVFAAAFAGALWFPLLFIALSIAGFFAFLRLRRSKKFRRVLGETLFFFVALGVFIFSMTLSKRGAPSASIAWRLTLTRYSPSITLSTDRKSWTIRTELWFSSDLITGSNKDSAFLNTFLNGLGECGWTTERGGEIRAYRERVQPAVARLLPVHTVNVISLDEDLRCQLLSFHLPEKSQAVIFAPTYSIGRTYPEGSRNEILGQDRVRLTLPIDFGYQEARDLRIEVISPLFRNGPGAKILAGAFWTPFTWLWAMTCAIFSEQIKKGVLVPTVRRLFKVLRLKWRSDKDEDDPHDKPMIITP